jgi:hypothetical protein
MLSTDCCCPAGTIIDRCYKITGIIGKGSFGAAYAAEHVDTGLQVRWLLIPTSPGHSISIVGGICAACTRLQDLLQKHRTATAAAGILLVPS